MKISLAIFGGAVLGFIGAVLGMWATGYDVDSTRCQTITAADDTDALHDIHKATIKSLSETVELLKSRSELVERQVQHVQEQVPTLSAADISAMARQVDLTIPPIKVPGPMKLSQVRIEDVEIADIARVGARLEEKLKLGFAKLATRGK